MNNKIKKWLLCILIVVNISSFSQTTQDTAALVTEFGKVMSFATQPYLYCITLTKINSIPVLEDQDTLSYKGVFYKNYTNLYFGSCREELYMQDSFMIQVNHIRKSIWVSKVDIDSKDRMNFLPVSNKQVQELFRKKYSISKTRLNGNAYRFDLKTSQNVNTSITTTIGLEYETKNHLPLLMQIGIHMQHPVTDEILSVLRKENNEYNKLLQTIDGVEYLIRSQNIVVSFFEINNTIEAANKMPSWKYILDYDEREFIPKGICKDYEVTKTF